MRLKSQKTKNKSLSKAVTSKHSITMGHANMAEEAVEDAQQDVAMFRDFGSGPDLRDGRYYYYLFLSWLGSPQQLLTSNPCPTNRLLNCKGPEKRHRASHSVLHRPNLQLFSISSREYDDLEGCSSKQFGFLGKLAKSNGQVDKRRLPKHDEAVCRTQWVTMPNTTAASRDVGTR